MQSFVHHPTRPARFSSSRLLLRKELTGRILAEDRWCAVWKTCYAVGIVFVDPPAVPFPKHLGDFCSYFGPPLIDPPTKQRKL